MDDVEFKKRVGWAINRISSDKHLGNIEIAKLLSSSATTVSNYRTEKNSPKTAFIISFCKEFRYNQDWFMTGSGEPFPGARDKYPEICGPEESISMHEIMGSYGKEIKNTPNQGKEFRISDALMMCTRVLESGTSYATALYFNIEHFDRAVKSEINQSQCMEDIKSMNDTISKMQTRMDEVEKDNKKLRDEIKKLQGLGGDSAPIALSMDHAAPTGTEDQET
jgi:hypothetical protein